MINYKIENYKLVFFVNDLEAFQEFITEYEEGLESDQTFLEAIKYPISNGLTLVQPEEIGALTDSLIFTENDYRFFWYPSYEVRNPLFDLINTGKCYFQEVL